jgi:hypothetical protein
MRSTSRLIFAAVSMGTVIILVGTFGSSRSRTTTCLKYSGSWNIKYESGRTAIIALASSGDSVSGYLTRANEQSRKLKGSCKTDGSISVTLLELQGVVHEALDSSRHLFYTEVEVSGGLTQRGDSIHGLETYKDVKSNNIVSSEKFIATR